MKYSDLINLGFERYNMGDGFNDLGFHDFYLFLKVNKTITFEWNWEKKDTVKMVRYIEADVQNYIEITDLETVKSLLYLYKEKEGNRGNKPKIGTLHIERPLIA
jgi:hypothetical protein